MGWGMALRWALVLAIAVPHRDLEEGEGTVLLARPHAIIVVQVDNRTEVRIIPVFLEVEAEMAIWGTT
jgi:hypothetical protein